MNPLTKGLALVAGLLAAGGAFAADGTIVLGAAVSLTGKYSTAGTHTKRGYDLAVARINQHGGVKVGDKTYNIAVQYYDDESTPARAAELAERLIKRDGVRFMLGPYSSGLTKAIAPVTEMYQVPMIEANGASRALFDKGYKYLFAVLSTSEQYLQEAINLAAEQAEKQGRKPSDVRVAVATENDPFSQDIRAGVLENAKSYGMKIVVDDKFPRDLSDMTATLVKVRALRPDILVASGHSKGAALVTRQMPEMKVKVPMVALTHCESAQITDQEKFGHHAEGTLCASQWAPTMTYRDNLFGSAADYAKLFEKTYGYVPPYQAAESSAAVEIYADAIHRAGSLDPKKVRDAIAATDMQTFYGNIRFDATGKNIAKPMVLRQIQKGAYVVVAPSKWATGKLEWPHP
ncbi:amino acid ABC transporter substrate-binding protein [Acidihalobacter prosperus]|uniref:Amino acid ABC transporter substrate-binding protein n=1 Tax=Acidihalobacter prosperus TaxID=160660 RepID=A0A1A6C0V1_9GAMM|nr:amino acid ABC transporter substrate-binding protein [Acidihalobacter prosperus]OBS08185.1 amino acid ABC transporter substrate-binding protein [Acidihalobacter prosperus]